jgi:hypothetical protein
MKDNKMKLLEVVQVTDYECLLKFDKRIESDSLLRGMYPDMINYKLNFIVDNVYNLSFVRLNKDFDIMKDLQVGNVFDYEDNDYKLENPTIVKELKNNFSLLDTLSSALLEYTVGRFKTEDRNKINILCTEEIANLIHREISKNINFANQNTKVISGDMFIVNGITFNFVIKSKEELTFQLEDKIIEYTELQDSKSNGRLFKIRIPNEKLLSL